jgi:hypothetical protein
VTNEPGRQGAIRHFCLNCAQHRESGQLKHRQNVNKALVLGGSALVTLALLPLVRLIASLMPTGIEGAELSPLGAGIVLIGVSSAMRIKSLFIAGVISVCLGLQVYWFSVVDYIAAVPKNLSTLLLGAAVLMVGFTLALRAPPGRPRLVSSLK